MSNLIPAWIDTILTPVDKLAVHQRGLRHKAVSVFVWRDGQVLLQRRALSKYHTPGLWANTCCTHPHWEEDSQICAVRRLEQELGITGLQPEPRGTVEYRAPVGGGLIEHEVVDLFVCDAPKGLHLALNPDEVMETRWMSLNELKDDIQQQPEIYTPWLRIYLAKHADEVAAPL